MLLALLRQDEGVVPALVTRVAGSVLGQIVDIQLQRLSALMAERGYTLHVSEAAREYLAETGYDPDFGARPLKRAIQRELQDPLAMQILSGAFHEGDIVQVDRSEDGLTFTPLVEGEVIDHA